MRGHVIVGVMTISTDVDKLYDTDLSDAWIQFLEFVALGSFLFPDCDGFVLVGTIGKQKSEWDRLIDSAGAPPTHTAYTTQDRTRLQDAVAIQTTQ
jgi:hypothetical protein